MKRTAVFILSWGLFIWTQHGSALSGSDGDMTSKPQEDSGLLAITHAVVIDGTGAVPKLDRTILIKGNRIISIGKASRIEVPPKAQVVDATGKYVIPGLWDMHVHLEEDSSKTNELLLYIANGVTGVRVMWGHPTHHQWRRQIEQGTLLGPRMLIGSIIVDGPKPAWPGSLTAANEAEGRQAVIKAKLQGADFIKVYDGLPRTAYFAIADETRMQGLTFAGHVPISISVAEASQSGQKSIEHLTRMVRSCSSNETEILKALQHGFAAGPNHTNSLWQMRRQAILALDTYSASKANALFKELKQQRTYQCPTLTVLHNLAFIEDPSVTNDSRLRYMPEEIRSGWAPKKFFFVARTAQDITVTRKYFAKHLEIVGLLQNIGVPILAGTDTPNPYCFPGFSLHDELGWLVQAGLTPMQALQAATQNAARFIGREKEIGTIEKGRLADLVLLNRNPLEDIQNTRDIESVVFNGRLLSRGTLDKLLEDAAASAAGNKE